LVGNGNDPRQVSHTQTHGCDSKQYDLVLAKGWLVVYYRVNFPCPVLGLRLTVGSVAQR